MSITDWIALAATIISTLVVLAGVVIGWRFSVRAQARETILDARERIRRQARIVLSSDIKGSALDIVSRDMHVPQPRPVARKNKSRWDMTVVIFDSISKETEANFVFSPEELRGEAVESALQSVSPKLSLDEEEKDKINNASGDKAQYMHCEANLVVLIFVYSGSRRVR